MDWNEARHPRAAAGAAGGGQFISYSTSSKRGTGSGKKGGDARVKRLQRALNALGLTDGKGKRLDVDGMLGPLTTQSVKAAQRKLGIKPDGRVTPKLLNQLEDIAAKKARASSQKPSKIADAWIRRIAGSKRATSTPARSAVAASSRTGAHTTTKPRRK